MDNEYTEERYLREQLAILYESYAKAAKPYIDRLVAIESLKPRPPMFMTVEQAEALGLITGGHCISPAPSVDRGNSR